MTDENSPYDYNSEVTVKDNTFTKEGSTFTGWNTQADGKGTAYAADDTFKITADTTLYAQWSVNTYTLTYDANGGSGAPDKEEGIEYNRTTQLSATTPTHENKDNAPVVFIGWSLVDSDEAVYSAGEQYPAISTEVTITDNTTVYAVWGYDTNGDNIADATQVMIQPAAMTIYTGGEGYLGTVDDENGTTVGAKESGLPEPGFYFTLPYDMNQAIKTAAGTSGNAADLSQYLTIDAKADSGTGTNEDRSWTIQLYDPTGTSDVNGKYVYSFDPGEGQDPVRMQFTNGEDIIISDKFDVNKALHQEYTMSLYTGSVLADTVQAVVKISGENDLTATVGLWDSTLTIRGVTGDGQSNEIATSVENAVTSITASTENGTPTYYINGSQIQVTNQDAVKLLVDSIVDNELENGSTVHNTLLDMAKDELPSSYDGAEFQYLDLVDSSNGNVWVTMGDTDSLTVYWPYPEGTDQNDDFTIIHYEGLDREFDLNALEDQQVDIQKIVPEKTAQGLKFEVSSFSPFALVYDKQSTGGGSTGGGTTGGGDKPELERGDHYAYIVGYEDETVRPQNNITRAEVATIFFRLLTQDSREEYFTTENSFSDVSADDWYSNTVSTLVNAGIIVGYEDGTFRPNAPITRAELAAIASRFDDLSGGTSDFSDISGHWAEDAINSAYDKGWVGGYPDGTFRPDQYITRAEVMSLVNRVLDREVDEDGMLDDMVTWIDNVPGAWYYEAVQEATNSHDYDREEGEVEDWTNINEAPDWPAIEAALLEMIGA